MININCKSCPQPNSSICSKFTNKDTGVVAIILTDECNFNCNYCWFKQSGMNFGTCSEELLIKLVHYLYDNYTNSTFSYAVLGGEPALYPNLIDTLAKEQLNTAKNLNVKVYTNGTLNADELFNISEKYENVTYNVSQNYDLILYKNMRRYCDTASCVIDDEFNCDDIVELAKHCKDLGYRYFLINFNTNNRNINNYSDYVYKRINLLKQVIKIEDEKFKLMNIFKAPNRMVRSFNFYPNGNFYMSHFSKNQPIGNINEKLDLNIYDKFVDESPCATCNNKLICNVGNRCVQQFVTETNEQKKNIAACCNNLINGICSF